MSVPQEYKTITLKISVANKHLYKDVKLSKTHDAYCYCFDSQKENQMNRPAFWSTERKGEINMVLEYQQRSVGVTVLVNPGPAVKWKQYFYDKGAMFHP